MTDHEAAIKALDKLADAYRKIRKLRRVLRTIQDDCVLGSELDDLIAQALKPKQRKN